MYVLHNFVFTIMFLIDRTSKVTFDANIFCK